MSTKFRDMCYVSTALAFLAACSCFAQSDAKDQFFQEIQAFDVKVTEGERYVIEVIFQPTKGEGGSGEKDLSKVQVVLPKPILGLTTEELPAALRSQLKIPADRGLIVSGFAKDESVTVSQGMVRLERNPSAHRVVGDMPQKSFVVRDGKLMRFDAGPITTADALPDQKEMETARALLQKAFKVHDIVLSLNEQPVVSERDIIAQLLKLGRKKPVAVNMLRDGKAETVQLQAETLIIPARRDPLFAQLSQTEEQFVVGIATTDVDEVTRNLLKLPKDSGIVVRQVQAGGVAEKAGIRQYDIILKVDAWFVANVKSFADHMRDGAGKEVKLTLMREGKEQVVAVTPQATKAYEIVDVRVQTQSSPQSIIPWTVVGPTPPMTAKDSASEWHTKHMQEFEKRVAESRANFKARTQSSELRFAVDSLKRAVERLEKKLDEMEAVEAAAPGNKPPSRNFEKPAGTTVPQELN